MSDYTGSRSVEETQQEIVRLNKIIAALIEHSESMNGLADSSFGVFQKTALLETEVNNRTAALDRAIDELESVNEALAQSKAKFQALFDLLPNPVSVSNLNSGILTDVNVRFCEVFGFEKGSVIGKETGSKGLQWWPKDADRRAFIDRIESEGGVIQGHELHLKNASGSVNPFIVSGRVLRIEGESFLVLECQDISEYTHKVSILQNLAERDFLTGLPNRLLILDRLQQTIKLLRRNGQQMAVAYLDLDGFKDVNDIYGHKAGDLVLMEAAIRLQSCIRDSDTVGRLGGDEFVVLLIEPESARACESTLTRIIASINSPFTLPDSVVCRIGVSIGYTMFPQDKATPSELLEHADLAMYEVKRSGKNRFLRFTRTVDEP